MEPVYQNILIQTAGELQQLNRKIRYVSLLRGFIFVAGIICIIVFWRFSWSIIMAITAITLVLFFICMKYHDQLFYQKKYLEKKQQICEQELRALQGNWSDFDGGASYIDPAHMYSFDIDVFGEKSLFQSINRTCTHMGKQKLAGWFGSQLTEKQSIERRQEAIQELTQAFDFRMDFRIFGLFGNPKNTDETNIDQWIKAPTVFANRFGFKIIPYLVVTINITCWILAITHLVSYLLPMTMFTIIGVTSLFFSSRISRIQQTYGKNVKILATYSRLLKLIEKQGWKTVQMNTVVHQTKDGKQDASSAIGKLAQLMGSLESRNNILGLFLLNGILFWELQTIMKIECWKEQYADYLCNWLNAIGEIDALCSLATFTQNHPNYTFPEIIDNTDGTFCFEAENMGHPLMLADTCIPNSISITERPYFLVVTGANMAGKSTYLRVCGINFLLACIGAPICGKKMKVTPVTLITSLRTSDSLSNNESYFFSELKRLKLIIDLLKSGKQLFIILDEILRGTNSKDKQIGSYSLVCQLMELRANGIIATHDLQLATLKESYPKQIENYCFESNIEDDVLTFPYRLSKGVVQNMNACFLMKKMGIKIHT